MRFRRNLKNLFKHGVVEDWLPFLFAVVFLFFIAIFFVARRSAMVSEISDKTLQIRLDTEANQLLVFYLQTPLKGYKEYNNVAELVISSYYNDEDKAKLKEMTTKYLNSLNKDKASGWNMDFIIMPDKEKFIDSIITYKLLLGEKMVIESHAELPLYTANKYIRLRMYRICQGVRCG